MLVYIPSHDADPRHRSDHEPEILGGFPEIQAGLICHETSLQRGETSLKHVCLAPLKMVVS